MGLRPSTLRAEIPHIVTKKSLSSRSSWRYERSLLAGYRPLDERKRASATKGLIKINFEKASAKENSFDRELFATAVGRVCKKFKRK